eukprot:GSA25T00024509001.1
MDVDVYDAVAPGSVSSKRQRRVWQHDTAGENLLPEAGFQFLSAEGTGAPPPEQQPSQACRSTQRSSSQKHQQPPTTPTKAQRRWSKPFLDFVTRGATFANEMEL